MNIPVKNSAIYVLAFSIFSLAAALVYFTVQIGIVSKQVPEILTSVANTSAKVEPVIEELGKMRDLVPPILEEVRHMREALPSILNEVALTREQIPLILEEAKHTRQNLPAILETANNASSAVVKVAGVADKALPLVPGVLQQVEKTRDAIPVMLDRAEQLIGQAKDAGKQASKGAVTGVLAGIITAPFTLIGDAGKKFVGASEEDHKRISSQDYAILMTAVEELIATNKVNEIREWKNPDSKLRGRLTLKRIGSEQGDLPANCRQMYIEVWDAGELFINELGTACQNDKGEWIKQ